MQRVIFGDDRQVYVTYPFEEGKWTSGRPTLRMGGAFWVGKAEDGNRERDLVLAL